MNLEVYTCLLKIKIMSKNNKFLLRLQNEASQQAKLEKERLLPKQIDKVSSFVAEHPWQVVLLLSFLTSIFVTLV